MNLDARREKTENEKGFRRFRRAKTPEKAFSGNYAFSARESAQVPVLQGERVETKRGLTAIAIRPRDKLGGGAETRESIPVLRPAKPFSNL